MSEISSAKLASFTSNIEGDIHGMCNLLSRLRLCVTISCVRNSCIPPIHQSLLVVLGYVLVLFPDTCKEAGIAILVFDLH